MSADPSVLGLWLWLIATVGHVWLTGHWVDRLGPSGRSRDERWFVTMLVAVGTLSIVLHGVAATVGLGLGPVLVALAAGHLTAALLARRRPRPAPAADSPPATATAWLERAAAVVLSAIVIAWLVAGTRTLEVRGTDAAHYHVPVAVNLALGESPLGLPTTQHLYPMASSTLAAWFLLPVGDALLIDLVMVLPFLLTAASLGWLFRLVTGQSGLAWCTWLTLAVFSMPMFRQASLMSADLLFAAAFAALAAVLLAAFTCGGIRSADACLIGLATGLLVGAKTTGLVAAVLLLGFAAVGVAAARWRAGRKWPVGGMAAWSLAAILVVGAGGIWLIRNWWLFGSPVAPTGLRLFGIEIFRGPPFEATTYLSVLGDLRADPNYDLASRTSTYIGEWFGRWYLLALWPAVLVPADALIGWWRRRPAGVAPRLRLLATVVLTGVPMVWLLVGAPWTSLEWTRGMALRYALPWFLLVPLLAWIGLFPSSLAWYRRTGPALVAGGLAAATSLAMLATGHAGRPFPPPPTWPAVLLAVGGWAVMRVGPRLWRRALVVSALGMLLGCAAWLVHRDGIARDEARAWRAATDPTPTQQLYAAVLASERDLGRTCETRRFFALTRFDEPLGVQDVDYRNRVYYAAREVAATARVTDPMGPCDYIVSARPMLRTAKAVDLIRVLNPYARTAELNEVGGFVLLGQR